MIETEASEVIVLLIKSMKGVGARIRVVICFSITIYLGNNRIIYEIMGEKTI